MQYGMTYGTGSSSSGSTYAGTSSATYRNLARRWDDKAAAWKLRRKRGGVREEEMRTPAHVAEMPRGAAHASVVVTAIQAIAFAAVCSSSPARLALNCCSHRETY